MINEARSPATTGQDGPQTHRPRLARISTRPCNTCAFSQYDASGISPDWNDNGKGNRNQGVLRSRMLEIALRGTAKTINIASLISLVTNLRVYAVMPDLSGSGAWTTFSHARPNAVKNATPLATTTNPGESYRYPELHAPYGTTVMPSILVHEPGLSCRSQNTNLDHYGRRGLGPGYSKRQGMSMSPRIQHETNSSAAVPPSAALKNSDLSRC